MTEKIDNIISSIQKRTKALKDQLKAEQLNVKSLEAEVKNLKDELSQKEAAVKKEMEEINRLHTELKNWQDKEVISTPKTHKEEDIDALVREIEYCIDQLKNKG